MTSSYPLEDIQDPFGCYAHDTGPRQIQDQHSGRYGHYCHEWDGLWICEDCVEEFEVCLCFDKSAIWDEAEQANGWGE